jgi:subtilase family serine protease
MRRSVVRVIPGFVLIAVFFVLAARAQSPAPIAANHSPSARSGWTAVSDDKVIQMSAMLALRNRREMDQLARDQQNRHSSRYHKWLTPDEFIERFGPTTAQMTAVEEWLRGQGFTVKSSNRRLRSIEFTGTVATIKQALRTSIFTNGSDYTKASEPELPANIAASIQGIYGLTGSSHHDVSGDAIVQGKGPFFGPSDFYKFYDENPVLQSGNRGTAAPDCVAVLEFGKVTQSELKTFNSQFKLPPVTFKQILVDETDPGFYTDYEAPLDVEWVHAVSPKTPIYSYLIDSKSESSHPTPYLHGLQRAVDDNICGAISSSIEDTSPCPDAMTIQSSSDIAYQAVMQGQTFFKSAGDFGDNWICGNLNKSGTFYDQSGCPGNSTRNNGYQPSVDEEAASPFLTSVGGTQFAPNYNTSGNDLSVVTDGLEAAWNQQFTPTAAPTPPPHCQVKDATGGGKSDVFLEKPEWQTGAGVPADGVRDIPDVSLGANGPNVGPGVNTPAEPGFWMFGNQGKPSWFATGGTSIATPMWAGISRLIAQGQGVTRLGNVNPRLYELGNLRSPGLHDVTDGDNDDADIPGYTAGTGFDLVTGWGSPDIAQLVAAFPGAKVNPQPANTTIQPSTTGNAGVFTVANTTSEPLHLTRAIVNFSKPKLFSSLTLSATSGGVTQHSSSAPGKTTTFILPAPLAIAPAKSAQVVVTATAIRRKGQSTVSLSDGAVRINDGQHGLIEATGLPANLGQVKVP